MPKKTSREIKLSPALWIAYGVLIGLGAAGLIFLLASPQRGEPVKLVAAPTQLAEETETVLDANAFSLLPTLIFPLNINTATLEQLQQLPNIGPTIAQAIINYRDSHGPFEQIEDIQNVVGIGPKTFDGISSLITIDLP